MSRFQQQDSRQLQRVTYLGAVVNLVLAILKILVGSLSGSIGLFADGIHSLSDLATDIAVLLGIHFGSKEPDACHPFGHGRVETFSAAVVAVILAAVGVGMIYKAAMDIARMHTGPEHTAVLSMTVIWVALLSIVAKEALYQITRIVAVRCHSTVLYANAWHHRSDALSSVAVLAGAVAVRFGYPYGDQLAAVIVGLMIIMVAVRILGDCFREFSERAVDKKTIRQIEAVLGGQSNISGWHKLRTRSVGREIFLDVHILVDPELKITCAHDISETLENELHEQITRPINVMIHTEPDLPELRKRK